MRTGWAAPWNGWLRAGFVGVYLLLALPAFAESPADIRSNAKQLAADIAAKKSSNSFDVAAQKHAIEQLGHVSVQFIEVADKAISGGSDGRDRESLLAAYQAVEEPLQAIYDQSGGGMDRMARKIMDEDGDIDALYESVQYKEAQVVGAQALYYLNWLHYYGGRLTEGAKRKEIFEKAQQGFSRFIEPGKRGDLQTESILGRGLSSLELGDLDAAAQDLKVIAEDPQVPAERRSKARMALLDKAVRAGNVDQTVKIADGLLSQPGRGDENLIRFFRAKALLDASKKASASEANRYRQQASPTLDQLRRAGGVWEERANALAASVGAEQLADPNSPLGKWEIAKAFLQKNDYKSAVPVLEEFVKVKDPALQKQQNEASYYLAVGKFQAGDAQAAVTIVDAILNDAKPTYAGDAAYLRFKAREALAAKSPEAAASPAYETAMRDYLTRFPTHKNAYEAAFRLGEWLHAQKRFPEAIDAYTKVQGDPVFETRAAFGSLQSRYEILQADVAKLSATDRTALLAAIGKDLATFERRAAAVESRKELNLAPLRAKVAVMRAVYTNLQPNPDAQVVLDLVKDFERRFPESKDLYPQAARLRIVADQALGKFTDAEADVKTYGPALVQNYGTAAIEELAVGFVREGARRNAQDPNANVQAQQVALRLYEQLPGEGDAATKKSLTLARLYENTGDVKRANELYTQALTSKSDSFSAIRGLARIAEKEQRWPDALNLWQKLLKDSRAGDAPWYEAHYNVARVMVQMNQKAEACKLLDQLKPAMPGLSDVDLRGKLDQIYQSNCK